MADAEAGQGKRRQRWRNQRGVAMVEFALIVLPLCIICFGTVDLARAYQLQVKLRNAAREGAAFAQYFPNNVGSACSSSGSSQTVVYRTIHADESISLSANNVTVGDNHGNSYTNATGCSSQTYIAGDTVTVSVSSTFSPITPLVQGIAGRSNFTLTGSATVVVQK